MWGESRTTQESLAKLARSSVDLARVAALCPSLAMYLKRSAAVAEPVRILLLGLATGAALGLGVAHGQRQCS